MVNTKIWPSCLTERDSRLAAASSGPDGSKARHSGTHYVLRTKMASNLATNEICIALPAQANQTKMQLRAPSNHYFHNLRLYRLALYSYGGFYVFFVGNHTSTNWQEAAAGRIFASQICISLSLVAVRQHNEPITLLPGKGGTAAIQKYTPEMAAPSAVEEQFFQRGLT